MDAKVQNRCHPMQSLEPTQDNLEQVSMRVACGACGRRVRTLPPYVLYLGELGDYIRPDHDEDRHDSVKNYAWRDWGAI